MNISSLPEVRVKGKDGKWYDSKPFVSSVKGSRIVIYPASDGTEIKRESLTRYTTRVREDIWCSQSVPESVKTRWAIYCVARTAEELEKTVEDTVDLLDQYGLLAHILEHYGILHTQGYEYMAELLVDELHKAMSAMAK